MDDIRGTVREDLWRTLQTVSEWIRVADAKAGATLAVDGVMLALLVGRLRGIPTPSAVPAAGFSAAVILAAVSGLLAIWTVVPRTRRLGAASMVHYGTIAGFGSAVTYHSAAVALLADPDAVAKALTDHIWTISRSAKRKYLLVTWAIRLLVGSLVVGMFAVLFL
jgi:hypothetical protein